MFLKTNIRHGGNSVLPRYQDQKGNKEVLWQCLLGESNMIPIACSYEIAIELSTFANDRIDGSVTVLGVTVKNEHS